MNRCQHVTCFGNAPGHQFLNPGSAGPANVDPHQTQRVLRGKMLLANTGTLDATSRLNRRHSIPDVQPGRFSNT